MCVYRYNEIFGREDKCFETESISKRAACTSVGILDSPLAAGHRYISLGAACVRVVLFVGIPPVCKRGIGYSRSKNMDFENSRIRVAETRSRRAQANRTPENVHTR